MLPALCPVTGLAAAVAFATAVAFAGPAAGCETALMLSIDVSGSIDSADYRLQADGLALALADPAVADALVQGQVALAVMHWSGAEQQTLVLPWQRMLSTAAVARFAAAAAAAPRSFAGSDTAVGQGLRFALAQFPAVADCARLVIDVSGDGQENAGFTDARARSEAVEQGVTINAIAIEEPGPASPISSYYARWVITPGGFVVTARGLRDYAATLQQKLLRELTKPVG